MEGLEGLEELEGLEGLEVLDNQQKRAIGEIALFFVFSL